MNNVDRSIPDQIQAFCSALPGAEAYLMHDHPAFRVGKKCFVIGGAEGLSVKVPILDQPLYLEDSRFTRTHYIGQHGWIDFDLDDRITWPEIERLILISYRLAATKKMLAQLDAMASA
jgi:predicted DNA-binding protein (MmcQ/YjbR family)